MPNILDAVREEFFSRLQTQTNWGKNQVQVLYTEVQRDVLASLFDNDRIIAAHIEGFKNARVVQDISKPPTRNRWREIDINDIHPDYDHESKDPFHNDSDINKGL
jgi:hypothetical protein